MDDQIAFRRKSLGEALPLPKDFSETYDRLFICFELAFPQVLRKVLTSDWKHLVGDSKLLRCVPMHAKA